MESSSSFTGWGIVIFLIILFAIFWGGFGNRGNFGGYNYGVGVPGYGLGFEDYKNICEGQKANIAQTATTQFLIEQQSAATRELIAAQTNAINTKIDFYGYQNERDKNAELQRENMELRNQLFTKDQLAPINAAIASIQCNMLRRPDVTGVGVACPSAAILNGLGINNLNSCGCNRGCGCNGVVI